MGEMIMKLQQNMTFCTHTDNDTQSTHMTGHSLMLIHLSCSCNRGGHTWQNSPLAQSPVHVIYTQWCTILTRECKHSAENQYAWSLTFGSRHLDIDNFNIKKKRFHNWYVFQSLHPLGVINLFLHFTRVE